MTVRAAARTPNGVAAVSGETRLDFATLHDQVLRAVAALRSLGIGPGDRVGYLGLNSIDYVVLLQAALRIGAVTVAINWRLTAREIAYIAHDAGLALLLTETARLPLVADAGIAHLLTVDGAQSFMQRIGEHGPDNEVHDARPDDVAVQLYTSGTTGHPKGALLTHENFAAAVRQGALIGEAWSAWYNDDVALVAMPQFHIGGTGWTVQALAAGVTMILLGKPEIADIVDAIARHRVTKMFAVPAVLGMILQHPASRDADLSSLRALLYGASPIPLDILKRSMALFPNARFIQLYGATETTGTIVYLPPEDHDIAGTPRMTGCGKAYPQVELRVVDGDGNDVAPGVVGEVLVRSPLVMAGYHNLPEATAQALAGGWYRTGDAASRDADGYLYLFDRVKDMICSGAENIYPAEIENILHEHPGVRDCAVIGVPDARFGEAVKACVVREPGSGLDAETLIAFARQHIAGFKVPRTVDFVTELPRNASGKILKKDLRAPYWPQGERLIG